MGVELDILGDFDVLIAHHVGLVDNLAAGYEAVWLVKGERTHHTLEEVGVANLGAPSDTLAPCTHMKRAREAARLSLVKREKLVSLDARQVVELCTARFATLYDFVIRLSTGEALARRNQALIANKLERWRLHETQAVEMKHTVTVATTHQQVCILFITD